MSRWEPNADERLIRAALELFVERGYDETTVAEITERAGLTKRTFFRYFADKREVLFGGQDELGRIFAEAIAAAPEQATPFEVLDAALRAIASVFAPERFEVSLQRKAVIEANTDLLERELLKRASLAAAVADALAARGVPEVAARLAGEVGMLAMSTAYQRWADPANRVPFADLARTALTELRAATSGLG